MNNLIKDICCPVCKNKLTIQGNNNSKYLKCSNKDCRIKYPIVAGIPVLLPGICDKKYAKNIEKQRDKKLREAFSNLLYEDKKSLKNLKILKKFSVFKYPTDMKVIDLGTGLGHTLKHLVTHFSNCYGVELDLKRIQLSHARNRIVCGDMIQIPFPDNFFDIAFCIGVVHHLPDLNKYLLLIKEIKRILKKNCLFMLWEPKPIFYRGIAEKLVFSPIGNLFNYSRMIRIILHTEAEEYYYWLSHYNTFFLMLKDNGFTIERKKRGLFKDYWVMRLT